MESKVTPWFPVSIHPVRGGVYQVEVPGQGRTWWAKWDGHRKVWCGTGGSVSEARKTDWESTDMYKPGSVWRGLTKESK